MAFQFPIDNKTALRLFEARHAEAFYQHIEDNRDHLHPWLGWVPRMQSADDTGQLIQKYLDKFARGEGLLAGVWVADQLAGGILYRRIDPAMRLAEIGYWLGASYTGQGIISRACVAMVDYAFDDLGLNRVEILCASNNRASRAIPERLDFEKEGVLRQSLIIHGEPVDMAIYSVLAAEWPGKKANWKDTL